MVKLTSGSLKRQAIRRFLRGIFAAAISGAMAVTIASGVFVGGSLAQPTASHGDETARLKAEASQIEIVRDTWGIAHVHGPTDADAVFGMIYAQAEDDFRRVELNYLTALGRRAEAEGPSAVWQDLRQRLFIDEAVLKADYASSPPWLRRLMNAWADGLNWYLATHPQTHPAAITRFEPWMALAFSEGSIGGDIERASLADLKAFYVTRAKPAALATALQPHDAYAVGEEAPGVKLPTGSNGIAIAPENTRDGHALLLINPHTSFYFRSELQMTSDEGLNAYGAATWGQFFIYQGFNPHIGWMHTSSGVDAVDEFAETIVEQGGSLFYRYGAELRPVSKREITIAVRNKDGSLGSMTFTVYSTHHGPIVRTEGGKWIALALMNRPVEALSQSFLRTRAGGYDEFRDISARFMANSSNNTILADDRGEIAYLHPQFVPIRNDKFDYSRPVDGSDPATDWTGIHALDQEPHLVNPPNGWIFNVNDAPWDAAGDYSPKAGDFPRYMDQVGENGRSLHAERLLNGRRDFSLEGLERAAYDPYMPTLARLVPGLLNAYAQMPAGHPLKARLKGPIETLKGWDFRWGADSVATTVAVLWGERLMGEAPSKAKGRDQTLVDWMAEGSTPAQKLRALAEVVARLDLDFRTWRTPWGQINRFQRLDDGPISHNDDSLPSIPVPFTTSRWGSLASFDPHGAGQGLKKRYGAYGNSFVAVVEFGPRVRALAVTAGGESGHPGDPHFADQAQRYAAGDLREVYFWPDQLAGHIERRYRPGL